ncbi:MAG: efflux RND transporter periplasmic adaptor subunit [Desulfuromonadales bacterium]|nr:efflux RND transporter periplasmic adaptor subunit [Desulfuromonadales bacterium]
MFFLVVRKSLFLLLLLMALVACGEKGPVDNGAAAAALPERTTNVKVQGVTLGDVQDTILLPGTVEAWEDILLSAELAGPVRWIGPAEGDSVVAGEAILRIDPDTQRANYERSVAEVELQRKKFERYEVMIAQQLISQQEYDNVVYDYRRAQADLEVERLNLAKSTLKSPVSGVLDRLLVDRGEYVSPGTALATVVQIDRLKVLVAVPERNVRFFKAGDRVTVRYASIDGEDGPSREGKIEHLAYQADALTRTYRAEIALDNPHRQLRPGMIVRVEFFRRTLTQVVTVPLYAVVERDGVTYVYIENNGMAHQRKVTTGLVVDDQVVILDGISRGERLIVKGQQLISDGDRVVVTDD